MSDFRKVIILRVFATVFVMALVSVGGIVVLNLSRSKVIKSYSSSIIRTYEDSDICNGIESNVSSYYLSLQDFLKETDKNERGELKSELKSFEKEINGNNQLLQNSANRKVEELNFSDLSYNIKNFIYYGNEILFNSDSKTKLEDGLKASEKELDDYFSAIKENTTTIKQSLNEECYKDQIELDAYLHDFDTTAIGFLLIIVFLTLICIALCVKSVNDMAERDMMTGLLNQDGLIQAGMKYSLSGKLTDYAGIYLNIKNFKYINRKAGSMQGDKILTGYAKKLEKFAGKKGIISRLGGDSFELLIEKDDVDEFLYFISSISENVYVNGEMQKMLIQSRCGIYPIRKGDSMGDVINCSTIACNEAKKENVEFVWFDSTMMEKVMNEKETIVSFPKALKAKEFVVYYQPKVNLVDNTLNGCEALVRWKKGTQCINPDEFIPVLEKEGKVTELDFYVFEQVCKDLRHWLDLGIEPVKVSSNFSKKHLHNAHLAEDILRIMIKYNIDCKYIEIELTESSAYEDFEVLDTFVKQMRMAGISVSIDDFGTGYSSLTLLKDLDVNVIKLDKSFINHINDDDKLDEIMIGNTVHMIHDLNRNVICEGVETKKQADFLRSVNCLSVQGYLFDKPLTSIDFEKRLQSPRYAV